jgi:hypothetical protein
MVPRSPLDDPRNAAHAWRRFARLMRRSAIAAVALAAMVCGGIYLWLGAVSIHIYIATALGIIVLVPLTVALTGLMFLSSGTGHDQSIVNPLEDEDVLR